MLRRIHVVTAVLENQAGRVLIAQRPPGKSLAGAWEFPGGKLREGEDRRAGLARELEEELGIRVGAARPLIRYRHCYPDLEVDLDAWRVTRWQSEPEGREGQPLDWRLPEELPAAGLLPADLPIVNAIRLPPLVLVTPPSAENGDAEFLDTLEAAVDWIRRRSGFSRDRESGSGLKPLLQPLLQPLLHACLRRPDLHAAGLLELAAGAACRIEGTGAALLLHGDPAELAPLLAAPPPSLRARLEGAVAGLHVPARHAAGLASRPLPESLWFGISCHDRRELERAVALGADYAFLGPVQETASHPGAPGLGWERFNALVRDLPLPVYAIGGLAEADLESAWEAGAQGIAAIRGFWP